MTIRISIGQRRSCFKTDYASARGEASGIMRTEIRRNHRQIRPSATDTLHNHVLSIINVLRCTAKRRIRCGLAEELRADWPRLPLGQARRPELPRSNLRDACGSRRRRRLPADLVPLQQGLRQLGPGATSRGSPKRLRPPFAAASVLAACGGHVTSRGVLPPADIPGCASS